MKLNYLQRKENVLMPWPIFIANCFTHDCVKPIYQGKEIGNMYFIAHQDLFYFCEDEQTDFKVVEEFLEEELLKNPEHAENIRKTYDQKAEELKKLIELIKETDFSKLSDEEIYSIYQQVMEAYPEVYTYSEPLPFFLHHFTERFDFKGNKEESDLMLTPLEKSFLQREREALLKIALAGGDLKKHTEEFEWIPYDYGAVFYDQKHFEYELGKLKKNPDLEEDYRKLVNYSATIKEKQAEIIAKYGLTEHQVKLFQVIQHGTYLMDAKKELFTKCHWYSNKFFTEISQRLKIEKVLAHYIFPEEMESLLVKKKEVPLQELKARYQYLMIKATPSGKLEITHGEEAQEIFDCFEEEQKTDEGLTEVKGNVAYPGKVCGEVKVIMNAKDCHKINHGEILVTVMTSPDYMLAAGRAAAIVTDEGGITTHAAIISREMKKPCIVGTKIATKVFKDGDYVEVDAERGVVKKIN